MSMLHGLYCPLSTRWFHVQSRAFDYCSLPSFQAVISQTVRDAAINDLSETMSDTYAFLCEADQMKQFQSQADILIVMAKQTEECAYFIHGYAKTKSFCSSFWLLLISRLVTLSFPSITDRQASVHIGR